MSSGEYIDDPGISDEAGLWRRIPPRHIIFDDNMGRLRPSKAAFENHPDGSPMSVFLAECVVQTNRSAEDLLVEYERFALAAITAGLAREKKQGVAREPLPDEPAHAVVFGRKTDSIKRALAKGCTWVVSPSAGPIS